MKKILALLLIISIGIFVIKTINILTLKQPKAVTISPIVLSIPTQTPLPNQNNEVHSPDGTMKIIMKAENKTDGEIFYSFSISDISGKNEKLLFAKTDLPKTTMLIPQNSFSPDNKYVFLQENKTNSLNALVFKASTEPFEKNEQYRDVGSLLTQNKPGYSLTAVTGWASPILLEVITRKEDSKKRESYWFVPKTQAFLIH